MTPVTRTESNPRMHRWAPPLALFTATQALYLATLHRGLPPLDSAEFIGAALVKGVPHPPGYPLYTMLGMLFSRLPFGSPEARVNFLSAFCGGIAVVLTYFIFLEIESGVTAAFLASLIFPPAPSFGAIRSSRKSSLCIAPSWPDCS